MLKTIILVIALLLISSCSNNKKDNRFFEQVANKANQKYKCNWKATSFNKVEACEDWEQVSGFEDQCFHVFFKKTKGSVYITVGKKWDVLGVEYIHHTKDSKYKNSKGSHSYCSF